MCQLIRRHGSCVGGMIDGTIGLTDQQGGVKIGAENTIFGEVNGHITQIDLHRLVSIAFGNKWQHQHRFTDVFNRDGGWQWPRPYRQSQAQWDNNKIYLLGDLASVLTGHFSRHFKYRHNAASPGMPWAWSQLTATPVSSARPHGIPAPRAALVASAAVSPSDQLICSASCGVMFMHEVADRPDHPDQAWLIHLEMVRPDTW